MSTLSASHVDRIIHRLQHYFSQPECGAWLLSYGPNRRSYDGSDTPSAMTAWYEQQYLLIHPDPTAALRLAVLPLHMSCYNRLLGDSTPLTNSLFIVLPTSHQLHIISSNTKLQYLQPLKVKAPFSVKLHQVS